MNEYEKLMDKILAYFAGPLFVDELQMAKKDFFDSTILNEENSEQYDLRMSQFYDWYFFTRELKGYGQTPLESCHLVRDLRFSEEENRRLEVLKTPIHSLFEFIKIKGGDVYIKDLFTGKKLVVKKSPYIFGFNLEEVFEARLIKEGDNYFFTKGFCFHPENAKKFIQEEIRKHKKDPDLNPEDFMLRLVRMKYKYEQYKHVKPEMIYSNESKMNL
jgi:hypothetical protein